jgi:pimeloyl-ACP methyl ester carboxylesterase
MARACRAGEGRDVSVVAQADRLLGWLQHLLLDRAVLVGRDLGGGVVQIAAVRRSSASAGLLITNGIAYDSWPIPSVKAMRAGSALLARLPAVALKPALGMLIARGHDALSVAKESLYVHHRPDAEHGEGAAMALQVRSVNVQGTIAVQDRLRSLRMPARIVCGAHDEVQKFAVGERLARDLGARLRRIEGASTSRLRTTRTGSPKKAVR